MSDITRDARKAAAGLVMDQLRMEWAGVVHGIMSVRMALPRSAVENLLKDALDKIDQTPTQYVPEPEFITEELLDEGRR